MASKKGKKTTGNAQAQRRVRMAYTLNNTQPVLCSIVGDEPLFYMDYEPADDHDITEIMAGLEHMAGHYDASARLTSAARACAPASTDLFAETIMDITGAGAGPTIPAQQAFALVQKSLYGQALAQMAIETGVRVIDSAQTDSAFYDRQAGVILVHPALDADEKVLLLARELRRVWQHRAGALVNPLVFHPDHALLVNRLLAADLTTAFVRIAWDLHLQGIKGPWVRLEASSMADLATAFSSVALQDFRTLNNGDGFWTTFEAWFLSDRCRKCDRQIIQQMLADYSGYVFGGSEESSRMLTTQILSALGSQPSGKNYLASRAGRVLDDPIFTDVRDRANANFLWFIKFEQSFKVAEQELQKDNAPAVSTAGSSLPSVSGKDYDQKPGLLIPLPARAATPVAAKGDAVILDFNIFRTQRSSGNL